MGIIENPILRGFNPDPSILAIGEDFYIATSTFEWFPGVSIYHSKNLSDWELISRPLKSIKHLDMKGNVSSGGVWAPCLSYSNGKFYLIFTDVKTWTDDPFQDSFNYITCANSIDKVWENPKFLNCSGFDPSLFHDDDGKKWILNMEWDYRKEGVKKFTGIIMQELNPDSFELFGPKYKIFNGTEIGYTEAPHIYKKDGYYYLLTAEGSTSYGHAITVARSKNITGPYEIHPNKYLVSSRDNYDLELLKAGHGSLCCGLDGRWWIAFLCSRPIPNTRRSVLGRETAIAEVKWENNWPYLLSKDYNPPVTVLVPYETKKRENEAKNYTFENFDFLNDFQTLRIPFSNERFELINNNLRIYGKHSIYSVHEQSLVARRQTSFKFEAETCFKFSFKHFKKMAGMIYRYNEKNQYYFCLTYDETIDKNVVNVFMVDRGKFEILGREFVDLVDDVIWMKLQVHFSCGKFLCSLDGKEYKQIGNNIDSSILSDEYVEPHGFTGAFIGMSCNDLENCSCYADFKYFKYIEK